MYLIMLFSQYHGNLINNKTHQAQLKTMKNQRQDIPTNMILKTQKQTKISNFC